MTRSSVGERYHHIGPAIFLASVGLGLVWWTRGTWVDPVVDSGRELYVAWRLSEGELLYRDVEYFNGPLSPYWNAFWFRVIGPGIGLLTAINGLIGVGIFSLLYALLQRIRGRVAATVACVVLLFLVGIVPRAPEGAYTFLAPYSHELTHGLFLLLFLIYGICRHEETAARGWLFAVGVAVGASFLTKPEIGLTVVVVSATWILLSLRGTRSLGRAEMALIASGTVAAPLIAWILFVPQLGPSGALRALATPFASAANGEVRELTFYRAVMGTRDLGTSIRSILLGAVVYGLAIGGPYLAVRTVPNRVVDRLQGLWMPMSAVAAVTVVFTSLAWVHWWRIFVPLQVIAVLVMLGELSGRLPLLSFGRGREARLPSALLSVAAVALLAKIFFNVSLASYGFVLAVPALALAITAICVTLPDALCERSRPARRIFVAYSWSLLASAVLVHLIPSAAIVAERTQPIGVGSDEFRTAPLRGELFEQLLSEVRTLRPGERLAAVPEGAMLNYLTRRPSSVPFPAVLPPEEMLFGADEIGAAFEDDPPEWIVTWDRELALYGIFGEAYGRQLSAWIRERYDTTWVGEYESTMASLFSTDTVVVRLLRRVAEEQFR